MTLATERKDWGRVVCSNLLFLRVVADAHAYVIVACATNLKLSASSIK